jgi:1-(5-phosphoribosyl)-5-[(5-phosphoribosylamino)methylideneamino] imidazole-4-carboxamide isomerase/N-(5'phosphoribosyl)anthranilate isomerase
MSLTLLPAVDLLDGQAARLVQGELGTETGYGDPVRAAKDFAAQGATWLHVVDLDAAFGRGPANRRHIARIVEAVAPAKVEASGGVRRPEDLEALLELGAARVVVGTAALEHPEWVLGACERHTDAVAVGLDARGRTLQARGWTASGGDLFETLQRLDTGGCHRFVYTEVAADGMLTGPPIASLAAVLDATERPVIASGGVSGLEDLRALSQLEASGLEGVIVGKALYAGRFTVAQALDALRPVSAGGPVGAGGPNRPRGPSAPSGPSDLSNSSGPSGPGNPGTRGTSTGGDGGSP